MPLAPEFHQTPVILEVADVEQLVESKAILPAQRDVRFDIIQLAEQRRERHMARIVERGVPEDQHAILFVR